VAEVLEAAGADLQAVRRLLENLCVEEGVDASEYHITVHIPESATDPCLPTEPHAVSDLSLSTSAQSDNESATKFASENSPAPPACLLARLWHAGVFEGATEAGSGDPGGACFEVLVGRGGGKGAGELMVVRAERMVDM
jgi:hypothetical protein